MTFEEISRFITFYINPYSGLPGIIFFLFFLERKSYNARIVFLILLASLLSEVSIYFFTKYIYPNSYIIANTWYLLNFLLVSWLFIRLLPQRRNVILLLNAIYFAGALVSFLGYYSFLESNTFIRVYTSVIFTILSLFAFFEILRAGPIDRLSLYPIFWIITGLFLFSSISLFKNLFAQYLVFEVKITREAFNYFASFNILFNIVKNLMIFYGFVLIGRGYPDYILETAKNND